MKIPELYELVSLFESEPYFSYSEDVPWYYNTLRFTLNREGELLVASIQPACGVFDFKHYIGDHLISHSHLEDSIEMRIEKLHEKEIAHIVFGEVDDLMSFYIVTKPYISMHFDYRRI